MVEAQPGLLPLLRSIPEIDAFVPLDEPPPLHDVAIESMELPHALRVTLSTLPASVPYLWPHRRTADRSSFAFRDRPRVGLVWQGGGWRPDRSLPLAALEPLFALPVEFVSLQLGVARTLADARFVAALDETASIIHTAEHMLDLDPIITVDTMAAHLAGALGRPVWLLLDSDADWRWMQGRMDSPWYPTMRLFRQERAGSWDGAVQRVFTALEWRVLRTHH
jgi:hypothetical protein